jgi:YD repeat-containing protein
MPNVYDKNYSYDTADRILAITDPTNSNTSSSFKHDALSRLIEQSLANKTFKYTYDANSNRLTRNQTVNGTATTENYTIQSGNNRINTITQVQIVKPIAISLQVKSRVMVLEVILTMHKVVAKVLVQVQVVVSTSTTHLDNVSRKLAVMQVHKTKLCLSMMKMDSYLGNIHRKVK